MIGVRGGGESTLQIGNLKKAGLPGKNLKSGFTLLEGGVRVRDRIQEQERI